MNASGIAVTTGRRTLAYLAIIAACSLGFSQLSARESTPVGPLDWSALNELVRTVQIKANKPISDEDARQMVLKGFMREVDANSAYLSETEWQKKQEEMSGTYVGIGITIRQEGSDMFVEEVAPGGPAARSGVRVGDQIFDVDGSLPPATVDELIRMVRGEAGTPVVITFLRPVKILNRSYTVEIIRGEVRTPTVFSGRHADTGLIQLKHFSETSMTEITLALAGLLGGDKPVKQLVLDLRGNPGGLYSSGLELAALFLPDEAVVSRTFHRGKEQDNYRVTQIGVRTSDGKLVTVNQKRTQQVARMPLAILVNRDSASASEVVTAALMDHGHAIVVGEKTYGKGTMQAFLPLRKESGMAKLTTQEFRSPDGRIIDQVGITPDVIVKRPPRDEKNAMSSLFSSRDLDPDNPDPMLAKAIEVVEAFRRNAEVILSRKTTTQPVPKH